MLRRYDAFTRFLEDGRICLSNNAAERALRCAQPGRKAWLFCSSDRGGQRAAILYALIQTAKLNDLDPRPGSPTSSPASPIIPLAGSTTCCPGTGNPPPRSARLPDGGTIHGVHCLLCCEHLGIDIDVIQELAEQMRSEIGCPSVVDRLADDAESVTAFTRYGIAYLEELLGQRRSDFMRGI